MKRIFVLLILFVTTACTGGRGYHVVLAPQGAGDAFRQHADFLTKNDCAPFLSLYTHGVHRDSALAVIAHGQRETIRLYRPLWAGNGSATLTLMADAWMRRDGGHIGTTRYTVSVDSWNSGQQVSWVVNSLETAPCPK